MSALTGNLDTLLQFASGIALATLTYICLYLSRRSKIHVFIVVGQDVFKWMVLVLAAVLISRLLLLLHVLNQNNSRIANSIVFSTAVAGIVWSVRRHGRS